MDECIGRPHCGICVARVVCEERTAPAAATDIESTNHDSTYQEENNTDGTQACRDNRLGKSYMDRQTMYDRGCNQNLEQEEEMDSGDEDREDLPSHANSLDRDTGERKRRKIHSPPAKQPLISPKTPRKHAIGMKRKLAKYKRRQWSDEALKLAIEALDQGHKMSKVCLKYGIPKSSLRDHVEGSTKTRRMGPNTILTQEEKCQLVDYIQMMVL